MLASDARNPEFSGAHDPDALLAVTFYMGAVQNNFQTLKQGRPIFDDRLFIRIMAPGNELNIIDTFATEVDKKRFPRQWAHFNNNHKGDSREIGTPVGQWPLLTPAQGEELKGAKFYTVEQIAGASDQQLQSVGMIAGMNPMTLRDKAKAYLAAASDTALPQMQVEEIAKRDQEIADLKAEQQRMAEQVKALLAAQQPETKTLSLKK